jgi:hypothetical protein
LAGVEKAGIPSAFVLYEDLQECFRQAARLNGVPELRGVHCSRTLSGPEDVERFLPELMDALLRPLTEKEKQAGLWNPSNDRVLFEGPLEEAEEFYSQTEVIPSLQNAPFCKYTDGLPIAIPTEERVAGMLKGTGHKPNELLRFQADHELEDRQIKMGRTGKKGDICRFLPMRRVATVEKIATIGVMAGCKPEHMPILLAMAEAGGGCGDGRGGSGYAISGPIARQIGMNLDVNVFGPGNPSNRALGRAAELMWRNLGGEIPAVTNCGVQGTGLSNCIPENAEALPPGWQGLNEEYDFKKTDNVLVSIGRIGHLHTTEFSPGGYRAFQKSGHGGMAKRLDVKGQPGAKNWLGYQVPGFWKGSEGGFTFFMMPEMARSLYGAGFKSKESVYEWIYKNSYTTVAEYRTHSWADMTTNGWNAIEESSGKRWRDLPDDYLVPACADPWQNCIIVTGGGEEVSSFTTGRGSLDAGYSIDAWK